MHTNNVYTLAVLTLKTRIYSNFSLKYIGIDLFNLGPKYSTNEILCRFSCFRVTNIYFCNWFYVYTVQISFVGFYQYNYFLFHNQIAYLWEACHLKRDLPNFTMFQMLQTRVIYY